MNTKINEPLVSIICVCFNHEKYIEQALMSFVNQKTSFAFEVLVHDDCSTDKSAQIIKKIAKKYPKIIVPIFEKENQYSKGKKIYKIMEPYVRGKYVAICEGDDYWCDDDKLELQVSFLEKNKEYVASCHKTSIFDCKEGKIVADLELPIKCDADFQFDDALNNRCHTSSFICLKKYYFERDFKGFDIDKRVGDYPLKLYLFINGKIRYFHKTMSVYRFLSNDKSYSSMIRKDDSYIKKYFMNNVKMAKVLQSYDLNYCERKQLYNFIKKNYYGVAIYSNNPFAFCSLIYLYIFTKYRFKKILHKT